MGAWTWHPVAVPPPLAARQPRLAAARAGGHELPRAHLLACGSSAVGGRHGVPRQAEPCLHGAKPRCTRGSGACAVHGRRP
eukprot:2810325-Lingulodinium_polyedra.AAC.1